MYIGIAMVYPYIRFFITFTFSLLLTGFLLKEINCDYKMVDKGVKLTRVYFVNCSLSDTTCSVVILIEKT